jgi:isopenicillin-N N-acyltransferase-like protein
MVIAHRDGEAIDVECTPFDTFFLYPKEGILAHSNHFLSPNIRIKDTGKFLLPDTVIREHRAYRLLHARREELQSDTIKEVLKDHFGHPNSICRHRDERLNPNEQWETLTSMIIDLNEGKMLYTNGPPCCNSYETVSMSDFN